jgi:D-tyrosyl-tRNA(Tyr) deacylase
MRAVLQRVSEASVFVGGEEIARIGRGWLILLGIARGDTESVAESLADRVAGLRCFEDTAGKTNLSARDVGAEMLVVSQFTLLADVSRGRRPGFTDAAPPEQACALVDYFADALRRAGFTTRQGQFGASMQVRLTNDGPFTIWLDTDAL